MSLVEVRRAGDLGIMVLNNGKMNQLSIDVFNELRVSLEELSGEDAVRAIVLAANPGPVFCAGADVNLIGRVAKLGDPDKVSELLRDLHDVANRFSDCDKPTIAAIGGICFGGGLELALACKHRVAGPLAQFALPEVSLGIIPGLGGTQRLPRLIGVEWAMQMILSGERISSAHAAELGIVDRVIEGDFIAGVKAFYVDIHNGHVQDSPPAATVRVPRSPWDYVLEFGKGKSEHAAACAATALCAGVQRGLREGLELEIENFVDAVAHPDAQAGVTAFLKKEKPAFEKVVGQ